MAPDSGLPQITDHDTMPANHLLVELRTRITTQRLHYRSGDEETAARSVHQLFPTTRRLLAENPKALAFKTAGLYLLNEIVRPYTARWHRWMVDERFIDERARRLFRTELRELQPRLNQFTTLLEHLVGGRQADADRVFADIVTGSPPEVSTPPDKKADLGGIVHAGIDPEVVPFLPHDALDHPGLFATAADINLAEREFIFQRRRALRLGAPQNPADDKHQPVADATGLCLSGGGIRSATFCLGIVQVLARQGMLHQLDYLSTVSGGGYLGSFLTAYLGTRGQEAGPVDVTVTEREIRQRIDEAFNPVNGHDSAAVRHLRNNSRYLLNGGLMGRLRAFGLVVSGILTNLLLVLPIPLLAVLVVVLLDLAGFWGSWPESLAGWQSWPAFAVFTWCAFLAGGAWLLLPIVQNNTRGAPPRSIPSRTRTAWELIVIVLGLVTIVAATLVILPWLFRAVNSLGEGVAALAVLAPIVFGLLAARLKSGPAKKVMTGLFTLSGPLFCLLVLLFVGNHALNDLETLIWVMRTAIVLALWGWLCVDINTFSPHGFYRDRLCECYLAARHVKDEASFLRGFMQKKAHGRKAKETAKVTGMGTLRQLPLSQINETHAAPYHLINTAVNLPASHEPNLRGRDCDFYLFSRYYCGGPVCGYVKTKTIEDLDPHVDLGTAMAVSGAAASVNMGIKTLRQFRFLLALLNVRLGYWLRNPKRGRRGFWNIPGPKYLFQEITGWMHENRAYLNLSDGGHIENLALYELLRRRCKFIIVVDGGMEPAMEFADLRLAQRYAEIDLGVRFDLDIADLALDASRRSRAYAIFGKIQYSKDPEELGWLIYLKLACTGEEPGYVVDYRRQNPDFPHQTTGDQLYDEAQFEAYRRLGECAAESLFRRELTGERNVETIRDWFQCLADNLLPDNDPAFRSSAPARTR